ncbi:MAG: ABC transporter substrate-binding protein [Acidimicrobiia bacterium]
MAGKSKLLALVLLMGLIVAACGDGGGAEDTTTSATAGATTTEAEIDQTTTTEVATTTAPPDPVAITVLTDFLLFGYHSPLYAAEAEGFFDEVGLDVTIEGGRGSADGATKIAAGAAQFGVIDSISSLVASIRGGELLQVAAYMPRHPGGLCYITERTTIDSYADVEGLTIGAAEGDAYLVALPGLMEAAGADPEGYEFIPVEPANTTAALVAGEIDLTPCGLPTFASRAAGAEAEGLTADFFSFADNGFDVLGFSVVVNGGFAADNPGAVQGFVDAWSRGVVWSVQNPEEAVGHFLAANPDKTEEVELANWTNVFPLLTSDLGYFLYDEATVGRTVDFTNEAYEGVLDNSAFTNEYVDQLDPALIEGNLP